MIRLLLLVLATLVTSLLVSAANGQGSCYAGPSVDDSGSYINITMVNNCGGQVVQHYALEMKGKVEPRKYVLDPCRTGKMQGLLTWKYDFTAIEYLDGATSKTCTNVAEGKSGDIELQQELEVTKSAARPPEVFRQRRADFLRDVREVKEAREAEATRTAKEVMRAKTAEAAERKRLEDLARQEAARATERDTAEMYSDPSARIYEDLNPTDPTGGECEVVYRFKETQGSGAARYTTHCVKRGFDADDNHSDGYSGLTSDGSSYRSVCNTSTFRRGGENWRLCEIGRYD